MSGQQQDRSAILAPGGNNNAEVPLLTYAKLAAERRGALVRVISWDLSRGQGISQHREMVTSKIAAAVEELTAAGARPLVIGKSLGSLAAPVAADRGLAAVWFTPLLTDELTVAALRRAAAPILLAGGTADPYWDGHVARSLTADVVEITGAGHAMFVPGPASASIAVLSRVFTAVEAFLDRAVWPA
ncbi:MAG: hypothetical protein ACLQFR_18190 [Streptosporangiaceae bacterium]